MCVCSRDTRRHRSAVRLGRLESAALDRLVPLVHKELHRLARRQMRGEPPRAAHAADERAGERGVPVSGRLPAGRLAQSDPVFRNFRPTDALRPGGRGARGSHKRCGAVVHVTLDAAAVASPDHDGALLALDEALSRLSEVDARKGRVPADGCSYLDGQCPNPEPVRALPGRLLASFTQ